MIDYTLKDFNNIMKAFNNKTLENWGVKYINIDNYKITRLIITINPKYGFHKDIQFDLHINFEVNNCNYPSVKIKNSALFNSIFTTQYKTKDEQRLCIQKISNNYPKKYFKTYCNNNWVDWLKIVIYFYTFLEEKSGGIKYNYKNILQNNNIEHSTNDFLDFVNAEIHTLQLNH